MNEETRKNNHRKGTQMQMEMTGKMGRSRFARSGQKLGLAAVMSYLALGQPLRADMVTDWNATFSTVAATAGDLPPVTGRKAAIIHAAIYDAVNGIAHKYEPFFVGDWAPG